MCCVKGLFIASLVAAGCTQQQPSSTSQSSNTHGVPAGPPGIEVTGRTQCVPSRKGIIAPVPLHPVVEVLVAAGDRVKKGQTLVKLDDDEPQADVRARDAALRSARIAMAEAQRHLAEVAKLHSQGATGEQSYHAARVAALKAEQDERGALAALESSKAELEHYVVVAPIDGVVSWLEVSPGMVSRPGTTVWGEIMDLTEIDVRCDLTPEQADRIAVSQAAAVQVGGTIRGENARVVFVGIAADKNTGLVPVLIRLPNTKANLRCDIPVVVRIGYGEGTNAKSPPAQP
jgi:RND family efflux transporter MFP subunit